jgi:hypothetical protein
VEAGEQHLGRRERIRAEGEFAHHGLEVAQGGPAGGASGHVIGEEPVGLASVLSGQAAEDVARE